MLLIAGGQVIRCGFQGRKREASDDTVSMEQFSLF